MKRNIITLAIILVVSVYSIAAERKPIGEVDAKQFATDTQLTFPGTGDYHVAFAWWVPVEYWDSIISRNPSMSEADKKAMLDAMSGVSVLAVVQADVSNFGAFHFYSESEVEKNMLITASGSDGKKRKLSPVKELTPDLEVVMNTFKPTLAATMGNLGKNMHFYVLNDKTESSKRILDPYQKGAIDIKLTKRNKEVIQNSIELPLNSLFVPRKCPNGKDAHVSWKYCPWTGQKLKD